MERLFIEDVVPYEKLLQTIESTAYTQVLKDKTITGIKLFPENSTKHPFYKNIKGVFESEEGTKITIFVEQNYYPGPNLLRAVFPSSTLCWIAEPVTPEPEVIPSIEDLQKLWDRPNPLGNDSMNYLREFKTDRYGQLFFLNNIIFQKGQLKVTFNREADKLRGAFIEPNRRMIIISSSNQGIIDCSDANYTPEYIPNLPGMGRIFVN